MDISSPISLCSPVFDDQAGRKSANKVQNVDSLEASQTINASGPSTQGLSTCSLVRIDLGKASFYEHSSNLSGSILCAPKRDSHPQEALIQELHEKWALGVGLWDQDKIHYLQDLNFCTLWTDCVPDRTVDVATIIPDYCAMFTVLDDTAERFIGTEGASAFGLLREAFGNYMKILRGEIGGHNIPFVQYPKYSETCAALSNLRERILVLATDSQYARFVSGMDSYYQGVLQQVYLSGKSLPFSRETQIFNREINVAFRPTIALLAIIEGIQLEPSAIEHPLFGRVFMAICRLGGVVNDIISFKKEVSGDEWLGQYHNLVAAEFNESLREGNSHNPLEEAIRRVFQFHNNEMYDFIACGNLVAEDVASFRDYHSLCASIHRSWMDWCLTVKRYSHAFSADAEISEKSLQLNSFSFKNPKMKQQEENSVRTVC